MPDSTIEDAVLVNAATVPPPNVALPTVLEVSDRLQFVLHLERLLRIEAQLANIGIQREQLDIDYGKTKNERELFVSGMRTKYSLTEQDKIDTNTGVIIRTDPPKKAS